MAELQDTPECWCGSKYFDTFSEHYRMCRSCGTLVATRKYGDSEYEPGDGEQSFYGKTYWTEHVKNDYGLPDIFERSRADLIERSLYWLKTIFKYKLPPAKTLELGCAHGGLVFLMKLSGFDAQGAEMSPWICDFAADIFDIPVQCGRIEDLSIESKSLDIVVLMDVLEHMTDPMNGIK